MNDTNSQPETALGDLILLALSEAKDHIVEDDQCLATDKLRELCGLPEGTDIEPTLAKMVKARLIDRGKNSKGTLGIWLKIELSAAEVESLKAEAENNKLKVKFNTNS